VAGLAKPASWNRRLEMKRDLRKLTAAGALLTIMVNSIFNGWRVEDVWLDK
jgi:hypothetical protein